MDPVPGWGTVLMRLEVDQARVREVCAGKTPEVGRARLAIRLGLTRFSEPGLSLKIGEEIVGEWMDSQATGLRLLEDLQVVVEGVGPRGPRPRYLISLPFPVLEGNQPSLQAVVLTLQL